MKLVGLRVLLIEDVSDIREVFAILLRSEGADVVATGSGREGADLAKSGRFDVVLSDLGLPDIAGDTLIRQIRSASGSATRVVVITGYGEPYITRARHGIPSSRIHRANRDRLIAGVARMSEANPGRWRVRSRCRGEYHRARICAISWHVRALSYLLRAALRLLR